ncbi:MAG: DUF2478 domain-containing protein [Magnetovibrio sp.]|nr:DUF2478 domain-containing protein [Magnetovibrio sp.]
MTSSSDSAPAVVGVVYPRGGPIREVLKTFVADLKKQGLNVHGILQSVPKDLVGKEAGCGVDAYNIKAEEYVELVRPTQYELDNQICSMDLGRLAEVSQILRLAIDDKADIVVVEKFGKHEKDGGGLSGDLMAVIAEDIPTVVSVPEIEKESWAKFTGGMDTTVECDINAIQNWWKNVKS